MIKHYLTLFATENNNKKTRIIIELQMHTLKEIIIYFEKVNLELL